MSQLTKEMVHETWSFVEDVERDSRDQQVNRWFPNTDRCCRAAAEAFGIDSVERVGRQTKSWNWYLANDAVDDEFVERVRAELPAQPWKPGTHEDGSESVQSVCSGFRFLLAEASSLTS